MSTEAIRRIKANYRRPALSHIPDFYLGHSHEGQTVDHIRWQYGSVNFGQSDLDDALQSDAFFLDYMAETIWKHRATLKYVFVWDGTGLRRVEKDFMEAMLGAHNVVLSDQDEAYLLSSDDLQRWIDGLRQQQIN